MTIFSKSKKKKNPYQPSVAFHEETNHLICTENQMAGFYMKCNIGQKWVKVANILIMAMSRKFLKLRKTFTLLKFMIRLYIHFLKSDFINAVRFKREDQNLRKMMTLVKVM